MATEAQIAANRANSQHSTGPVTEEGRAAVAENRTTHGLSGKFKARDDYEMEQFKLLFEQLCNDYQVSTSTEITFVHKMVDAMIRSERAMRLQDLSVDMLSEYGEDDECAARYRKEVELYIRYQASHDRALQRYAAELRKFQSEKKKAEIGFESQKREQAEETRRQERHELGIAIQKARLQKLIAPAIAPPVHPAQARSSEPESAATVRSESKPGVLVTAGCPPTSIFSGLPESSGHTTQ
jgi:hypothetical protein